MEKTKLEDFKIIEHNYIIDPFLQFFEVSSRFQEGITEKIFVITRNSKPNKEGQITYLVLIPGENYAYPFKCETSEQAIHIWRELWEYEYQKVANEIAGEISEEEYRNYPDPVSGAMSGWMASQIYNGGYDICKEPHIKEILKLGYERKKVLDRRNKSMPIVE